MAARAPWWRDRALRGLLAANCAGVALALWQRWPLVMLLWPYWCQSVVIGWFARQRMLMAEGARPKASVRTADVRDSPLRRIRRVDFFALHYGGFHLLYAIFLLAFTAFAVIGQVAPGALQEGGRPPGIEGELHGWDPLLIAAVAAGFWLGQREAFRTQEAADRVDPPDPASLMFLPYLRVMPMHLTLLLALPLAGPWAVLLFGALRTGADIAMQRLEQRWRHRRTASVPDAFDPEHRTE
jgi:hypothetical protein